MRMKNMNASSSDEVNNDKDSPDIPYDGENINAYYNNERNNDGNVPTHIQMM